MLSALSRAMSQPGRTKARTRAKSNDHQFVRKNLSTESARRRYLPEDKNLVRNRLPRVLGDLKC